MLNWKRLSPYAVPAAIRLCVVILAGIVLTYVLLVSDPTRIFRWLPFRAGRSFYESTPDWMQHFTAYLTFAFILRWYAAAMARWVVPCLVGFAVVHAMVTEYLQRFVPERTSDLKDLVVNFLGITAGTLLGKLAMWVFHAQQPDFEMEFQHRPQRYLNAFGGSNAPACGLSRDAVTVSPGELKPSRVLNYRFLGGLSVTLLLLLGTVYSVHGLQVQRHAGSLMELGRKAQAGGDLPAAKGYFRRYIGLVPNDLNALADFGQLLDRMHNGPREARQVFMVYEELLRADPTREDIRRRQIEIAMDTGRIPDALMHVKVLRQSYPTEGRLDYQSGRCLEELAEYDDAVKAYEAALEHSPDLLETYGRLAWLFQTRLDRSERARKLLDNLVERFRQSPTAWLTRGRFHAEFDSLDAALPDIEQARKLAPDAAETVLASAKLAYDRAVAARAEGRDALVQRIVAEARQQLQHGVELHPEQLELRLHAVLLEAHFGSPTAAQRQIEQLLELSPRDARAHLLLADMTIEQGRFEQAQEAIEKLPRTPGSDALRLFLQGRVLMSKKQWPAAIEMLEQARRITTQVSGMLERTDLALAQCHAALDDADAQAAAFRRMLKTNPQSVPARLGLAAGLLQQQKLKEAIAEYRSLSNVPQVRLHLARLLIVQNLQLPELARDWSEVEKLLDQAKEQQEDPVNEVLLRAELLAARGQINAAREVVETARTTQTDRVEFWIALSRLAERSGDARQARVWMGQALSVAGDSKQAEDLLRKTCEQNPADINAAIALLQHLVRHGQRDAAQSYFQELEQRHNLRKRPLELAQCHVVLGQDDQAATLFRQLLEQNGSEPAALRALAELHLRHQQLAEAEPLLTRLIDAEATLPASDVRWARRQLAVARSSRGQPVARRQALKLLDRNEKDATQTTDDLRARAFVLATSNRHDDQQAAVVLLGQLADRRQLLVKDRWLLARLLETLGQMEEADTHFRQVLAESADSPAYLAEFISSLIRRGQLDEAEKRLTELRRRQPDEFSTLTLDLQWQVAHGEASAALKRLETLAAAAMKADQVARMAQLAALAESLDPQREPRPSGSGHTVTKEPLPDGRGSAIRRPEFAAVAERLYRACAAREPRFVVDLVRHLTRHEKTADAFSVCLTEWSRLPAETAAPLGLSLLSYSEGRAERLKQLETKLLNAVEQQPKLVSLSAHLADLRCWQERYDAAEELYRRVLNVDSDHTAAANNLAWLLAMREHDLDDALHLVEKLIERLGPMPQLLDTRGCVYLALHRFKPALQDFTAANEDSPSATTLLHLAVAQAELGDKAAAVQSLEQARRLGLTEAGLHPLERPWLKKLP